jgi:hypothetical protein
MAQVEVYHSLGSQVSIETVIAEGLKSRRILIEEGKLEPTSNLLLRDQNELIYFTWMNPDFASSLNSLGVSIYVDSEKAKVFNAEFRYSVNKKLYLASELPLSELIEKKEKGEAMKGTIPGKSVVYNPTTAEPTLVELSDARVNDRHWIYSNEIPVRRDLIPASEFKSYQRTESK